MTELIRHWIAGKFDDATPQRTREVFDPATGQVTKRVAFAAESDVDGARWSPPPTGTA
jgi:malonate-semialdehyde dehydrogenase (acetylating)/methylmalonate-semialdehyde dehydrogenase